MYISKKIKEEIRLKYDGKCAYSGTELEPDWQADHLEAVVRDLFTGKVKKKEHDILENMMPTQRLINLYKHSYTLDDLRCSSLLGGLHLRLKNLPKNPITEKSKKHKSNMLKIAEYFNISEDKPFCGKFYFEILQENSIQEVKPEIEPF